DPGRDLPMTDPFARQLTISMGCFLEAMVIGASATGHGVVLDLFPRGEGPGAPVAEARLVPGGATRDPLFAALPLRRSAKVPYEARAVTAQEAAALLPLAEVVREGPRVARLREMVVEGFDIEVTTPRTFAESVDLVRVGRRAIEAAPDGIPVEGVAMEAMRALGMASRAAMMDPASPAFRGMLSSWHSLLDATPAWVIVTTPDNSRATQIAAGRRWMRLNLTTTQAGLALHPVSQILQEYPEVAALHAEVHEMFAPDGGTVQMLGRLGHAPRTGPTPRWPIEARMRPA
ncbi:MAG: twin-arginine translocation pathway signal protein, partial [Rhodobacteraceae bacterium]|nr:twin-arginine translocation pathway signal protein [Paracoccaceae bacterium]